LPQQNTPEYGITQYSEKKKEEKAAEVVVTKPKKMVESVGVGTSFYYADS
jgi:hypothetical protein